MPVSSLLTPSALSNLSKVPPPVLGVSGSASGRCWVWRHPLLANAHNHMAQSIALHGQIEELPARILAGRGITAEQIAGFLNPRLRDSLPDPSILQDMDKTAQRLADSVEKGETIGIFGDYDVDGACGTALLASVLRALGCQVPTHIPDRITEGYGPNITALQNFTEKGATLLICVDCGTAAIEVLDHFEGKADRIILDHHKPDGAILPKGLVVNPNRLDCESGLGHICATAVAFLCMIALCRTLGQRGWFNTQRPKPDLLSLLDITALATICDMMPLRDINRLFVTQGLKIMNKRTRPGLAVLADIAGVKNGASAMSCGFALGPRINAGGRIAKAQLGLDLLLSKDEGQARPLAEELDRVNLKRQTVEGHILDAAINQAEQQLEDGHAVIFLYRKDWHPGVVGIVAGRLKERFNRPALIGTLQDGLVKGSARSVAGLDIGNVIIAARQAGLLTSGGGHAMAAGFSVTEENIVRFHRFLDTRLAEARHYPRQNDLLIDGVITSFGATAELARQLARLEPFGTGHDEPVLVVTNLRCVKADRIGRDHNTLRVILVGEDGQTRLKGLVFRADDKLFTALLEDRTRPLLHLAGQLRLEYWQERENLTFFILDAFSA